MTALGKTKQHPLDRIVENVEPIVAEAIGGRRGRESHRRYNGRWLMVGEPMPETWDETPFGVVAITSAVLSYLDLVQQGGGVVPHAKEMLLKRVAKEYWRAGRRSIIWDEDWLAPVREHITDVRFVGECLAMASRKYTEGKEYRSRIEKERRALARGGMMPRSSQEIILAFADLSRLPGIARVWASGARSLELTAAQAARLIGRLGYGRAFKPVEIKENPFKDHPDDDPLKMAFDRLAGAVTRYRTPNPLGDSDRREAVPFDARVVGRALTALGFTPVRRAGINTYVINALSYKRARKVFRDNNPIPRRQFRIREGILPDLIKASKTASSQMKAVLLLHIREAIRSGRFIHLYDVLVEEPPPIAPP